MDLYVETNCFYEQTREPYSDDNWDRGDSHTDISIARISTNKIGESVKADDGIQIGDEVFLVWAHWGSGDTFGHDSGCNAEFYLVTKDETRANALKKALESAKAYSSIKFEDYEFYCPWFGYFESLEGIYVEQKTVT